MDTVSTLEMTEYKQWLLWKFDKGRKVPLNEHGMPSGVDREHDFMDYETALAASNKLAVQGVAFVFTKDDPFIGVDLDDAVTDDFRIMKSWAADIATELDCYTEISPSLRGLKIFAKGKLPEGARNRFSYYDGEVEVYEHGRFFTVTGCDIYGYKTENAEVDIAKLLGRIAPKREEPKLVEFTGVGMGGDLEERARGYLSGITLMQGSRNNTAFSAAGSIAALLDDSGRGLSEDMIHNLMQEWNGMQASALTSAEIKQVTQSALRNGTPRAPKPPNMMTVRDVPGVDLTRIMEPFAIEPSKSDVLEFPKLEFRGLVGMITKHIVDSSLYPQPEFAFAAALSIMSVLTGRVIKDESGCRTNIYCACVGPSGCGKDWPRVVIQQILKECDPKHSFGPQDIASSAGLLSALRDLSPAMLFPLDELGLLLGNVNGAGAQSAHLSNIGKVFLELYGSSGRRYIGSAYADVDKTPVIDEPHAVVYGSTTPSTFWQGMTEGNLTSGLMARFLVFEGAYVDPVDDHREMPLPKRLVEMATAWGHYKPVAPGDLEQRVPKVVTMSDDARARLKEHRRDITDRRKDESEAVAALWSRVAEKSQKLALLLACGRHNPSEAIEIDIQDMDQAIAISNWSCRYLISKFQQIGDTAWGRTIARVEEWIRHERGNVTARDISRRFRGIKKRERNEIIQQLQESGAVEIVEVQEGDKVIHAIRSV